MDDKGDFVPKGAGNQYGPGGFDTPIHGIGGKGRWLWKGWGD